MTNEQFEKHAAFIVAEQAQFRVDMQLLKEAQARTQEAQARTQEAQARTERAVTRTEQVVARNAEAIARTSQVAEKALQAVGRTTEAVAHTADTVARLAEVTTHIAEKTHERFNDANAKINALIDSQMRTDDKMKELAESQKLMVEAVRKLAATVNRRRTKDRNGENN